MGHMFWSASPFNGAISKWDVSCVTNMTGMFWVVILYNGDVSVTHSLTHSLTCTHSLTHSLTHLHSLTHSLTHSP